MRWRRVVPALVLHSLLHPRDAVALARVGWRFRRRAWWRRFPFVPVPSAAYVEWRMHTAYGNDVTEPAPDDLVRYARWATRD